MRHSNPVGEKEFPGGHVVRVPLKEALAQHLINADLVGNLVDDFAGTPALVKIEITHFCRV